MREYRLFYNPISIIKNLWSNKYLLSQFVIRELQSRYKGSYFGILWSFISPLLMLVVYTFVFSVIFKAKWGMESDSKLEFALILFCGITVFNIFAEVINRSPSLITSNVNFVKKVVFPLEILPIAVLGSAIIHSSISFIILIVTLFVTLGIFNWTLIFFPIVLLPIILITAGLGWFISSLGVYVRDIGHVIGIIVTALMFLSPVFYPITAIPKSLQFIYLYNPLSYVVEDMRRIIIWGMVPDWGPLLLCTGFGVITAVLGFVWFQKVRGGFADVL